MSLEWCHNQKKDTYFFSLLALYNYKRKKMTGNDKELINQSNIKPSKRNIHLRKIRRVKLTNSSFPNRWLANIIENSSSIFFYLFSFLNNKSNKTGSNMGSCFSWCRYFSRPYTEGHNNRSDYILCEHF